MHLFWISYRLGVHFRYSRVFISFLFSERSDFSFLLSLLASFFFFFTPVWILSGRFTISVWDIHSSEHNWLILLKWLYSFLTWRYYSTLSSEKHVSFLCDTVAILWSFPWVNRPLLEVFRKKYHLCKYYVNSCYTLRMIWVENRCLKKKSRTKSIIHHEVLNE